MLRGERDHSGGDLDPLAIVLDAQLLDARDDRVHTPHLTLKRLRESPVGRRLRRRHILGRQVGDRNERTGWPAKRIARNAVLIEHEPAAVGALQDALRQISAGDQLLKRGGIDPFGMCRQPGHLDQLDLRDRPQPPVHLDLVSRACQLLEKLRREEREDRVLAVQRQDPPAEEKVGGRGQSVFAFTGREEALDHRS